MNIIQSLFAEIDLLFPDNHARAITEADIRQQLKDILSGLNQDYNLDVPTDGQIVTVTPSYINTTIRFKGIITDNFTLNIIGNSADLIPGLSKLFIMWGGDDTTNNKTVTFSGNIQFTQCGTVQATWNTASRRQMFPLIWDGDNFTGVDNC